jgi:hypothetical protein
MKYSIIASSIPIFSLISTKTSAVNSLSRMERIGVCAISGFIVSGPTMKSNTFSGAMPGSR